MAKFRFIFMLFMILALSGIVLASGGDLTSIASEYAMNSNNETVQETLVLQHLSGNLHIFKFSVPQDGNSDYLILDDSGRRITDPAIVSQAVFSVKTYEFITQNNVQLCAALSAIKDDIESLASNNELKNDLLRGLSKAAKKISVSMNVGFLNLDIGDLTISNPDDVENMIDALSHASDTYLKSNPMKYNHDIGRFYRNELTLEEGVPNLLKKPGEQVTKLTGDFNMLQKLSIPQKKSDFAEQSQKEWSKISKRVENKKAQSDSAYNLAKQSNDRYKKKIKAECISAVHIYCSNLDELKNKYDEFNSNIRKIDTNDEKYNTYIKGMNLLNQDIDNQTRAVDSSRSISKIDVFAWWKKLFLLRG